METGRLEIARPGTFCGFPSVSVTIDGRHVGGVQIRNKLVLDLPPRRHSIDCEYAKGSGRGAVEIVAGQTSNRELAISKVSSAVKTSSK